MEEKGKKKWTSIWTIEQLEMRERDTERGKVLKRIPGVPRKRRKISEKREWRMKGSLQREWKKWGNEGWNLWRWSIFLWIAFEHRKEKNEKKKRERKERKKVVGVTSLDSWIIQFQWAAREGKKWGKFFFEEETMLPVFSLISSFFCLSKHEEIYL